MEHFPFLQLSVTRLRELKATLTKFSRCPGEPAEMQLLAQEVSGGASDPRKPLRCGCCWLRGPPWNNKRVQDVTEATQLGVTGFKPRSACSQSPSSLHRTLGAVLLCSHVSLRDAGRLGSAGREARDACLLAPGVLGASYPQRTPPALKFPDTLAHLVLSPS